MIHQCYYLPEHAKHLFPSPVYSPFGLEPDVNPELTNNCRELECPILRLHLVEVGAMLFHWRNPALDRDSWIGFTSHRQLDKSPTVFTSNAQIESMLDGCDIVAWNRQKWSCSIAGQAEACHPGITSFLVRMCDFLGVKIPGDYFELSEAFYANYWLMRRPLFQEYMEWMWRFIDFGCARVNTDPYLLQHSSKGLGYALERLFIIWYLTHHWRIFNCSDSTVYVDGAYAVRKAPHRISLAAVGHNPQVDRNLMEAARTRQLAQGTFTAQLEQKLSEKLGVQHVVSTCNGTMADAIALLATSLVTGRQNVVVPALTFIAQANAIRQAGLNPIFMDVEANGLINSEKAAMLCQKHHAILYPTHLLGKVCPLPSEDQHIPVVEDACEALGSTYNGRYAGTLGLAGTFSFFVSHSLGCGEGGAVVTNSDDLAHYCRSIRNHGRLGISASEAFRFPRYGFNGKMSNVQAAVACAFVDELDQVSSRRKHVASRLAERLEDDFGVVSDGVVPHAFPVRYTNRRLRDAAIHVLTAHGIECRPLFSCVAFEHFQMFEDLPNAICLSGQYLYVPCHQFMTEPDVAMLSEVIRKTRPAFLQGCPT